MSLKILLFCDIFIGSGYTMLLTSPTPGRGLLIWQQAVAKFRGTVHLVQQVAA
jgi:hypothetical protein